MNGLKTALLLGFMTALLLVAGEAVGGREGLYIGLGLALATAYIYGGHRRQLQAQTAASAAGLPGAVAPATTAAKEFVQAIPVRDSGGAGDHQLRPPGTTPVGTPQSNGLPLCQIPNTPNSHPPVKESAQRGMLAPNRLPRPQGNE